MSSMSIARNVSYPKNISGRWEKSKADRTAHDAGRPENARPVITSWVVYAPWAAIDNRYQATGCATFSN